MALPAGYYEAPLSGELGETFYGVWLPLKLPAPPLGSYKSSVSLSKKLKAMVAMKVETGLPGWIPTGCLPTVDTPIATATADFGTCTPEMVADTSTIKGLVIYLHGLSDGPPSLAHLFEKLAALGFICAAPSFTDDDSNDVESVLAGGFQNLEMLHTHRIERTRACIAALKAKYGASLPLAFIGYSTGADTIRLMPESCARIYMGGPGWLEYATGTPISTPPPGGPSLQLLAVPDASMSSMVFAEYDSTRCTGFPLPDATAIVPADGVAAAFRSGKAHLRVDFDGWAHGSFKHPPFAASEDVAWRKLACGMDPWKIVDLVTGRQGDAPAVLVTPEMKQQRADSYTDVIVSWLLAVLGA